MRNYATQQNKLKTLHKRYISYSFGAKIPALIQCWNGITQNHNPTLTFYFKACRIKKHLKFME